MLVRGRIALLAVVTALASPTTAGAHVRTGAVGVDYRVTVFPTQLPLSARVYPGDRALRLTVRHEHTVTVLGYGGEPFLRFGPSGAAAVAGSPTAASLRLAGRRTSGRTPVWHAARVRG